jgi:hypothetical protein
MPFDRFRTMEEAREALWANRAEVEVFARIRRLWSFARRLAPGAAPRGLRRFRTLEEASREREAWIARRARALRDARERT